MPEDQVSCNKEGWVGKVKALKIEMISKIEKELDQSEKKREAGETEIKE